MLVCIGRESRRNEKWRRKKTNVYSHPIQLLSLSLVHQIYGRPALFQKSTIESPCTHCHEYRLCNALLASSLFPVRLSDKIALLCCSSSTLIPSLRIVPPCPTLKPGIYAIFGRPAQPNLLTSSIHQSCTLQQRNVRVSLSLSLSLCLLLLMQ